MNPTGVFGDVPDKSLVLAYVSIDPGQTTGITLWDRRGNPLHYNELDIDNLHRFLDMLEGGHPELDRIIIEEFRLYQHKAKEQSGSKLVTVQVIGMVKRSNYKMGLPDVVEVRADNKEVAAKWSGTKIPKGHMRDWMSSYLIGYWWLHYIAKIIPARILRDFNG